MNERLKTFLEGELEQYDGYRALQLPKWGADMCYPICFEPDYAADEFEMGGIELAPDMVLLAAFYEPNSIDQLNGIWAFLLAQGPDNEIVLFDDEGPESTGLNLDEFLATLIPPTDARWRM